MKASFLTLGIMPMQTIVPGDPAGCLIRRVHDLLENSIRFQQSFLLLLALQAAVVNNVTTESKDCH